MSTRCNIHFAYSTDEPPEANIYRHSDGYPEGEEFFTEVEAQTTDTRFNDPSYLAAKFVVWQAGQFAKHGSGQPLDFLSLGVTNKDAGDGEYVYTVICGNGRPEVIHREA